MFKNLIVSLSILVLISCGKKQVEWISTTEKYPWIAEKNIVLSNAGNDSTADIIISTSAKAQQMDGFGGCFNELGWDALQLLDTAKQNEILKELFSPEGFNFVQCRMPIGANDYSRDYYSLNDSSGDFEMKYFNVNRDSKILVPYIKMAMKYNPSLKIWGSPWCPPKWMKVNNHYACHSDSTQNDLKKSGEGKEGHTQFIMKEEYLKAYALYFAKYVQTYRALGINVYAVHVQNESSSCQNFPSCVWDAAALNTFIGKYLGPEFESLKLDADIWLGTIERPSVEKIDTVITDPFSSKYVKGVGFQWAGKGAIAGVHKKYPDLHLMQTETECGDGSNDWKAAEHTWELMNHYMNNGANAYMYWNMVLDETGKSKWGWKQNSMISVDSKTHQVTYHPEFYLMKHLTHFVLPGAYCLESKTKDALAFINPDGKVILLLGNTSDQEKALQIKIDKKKLAVTLKPKSFNSLSVTLP